MLKKEKFMEKSSLLGQWKDRKKTEAPINAIGKVPVGEAIPLSHSQRRLWFLQQLYPKNPVYNYTQQFRLIGDLHLVHLVSALSLVFENHDILRAIYYLEDGQPYMRISSEPGISTSQHDLRGQKENMEVAIGKIRDAEAFNSFDLSQLPVALVSVLLTKENEHVVLLTFHHISMDKWSMNLLTSEWAKYYQELLKGNVPVQISPEIQYPDFAYWQRNQNIKQYQLDYWKGKLSGDIPIIDLPTDYPRPKESTFTGKSSEFLCFSETTSEAILRTCKELGVTPYVFFLSVYYLFLYRYTGQKDILIGSPISNRDQKQLENTIGFFNDTVVLRTEISPNYKFIDLIAQVKKITLEAFSNKDVPFDLLVRELQQERSLSVNPFFQVMFLYYSVSKPTFFGNDLEVDHEFYNPGVSKFDLTLDVAEENGALSFAFEYSTELFTPKTIARFQEHIAMLVNGIVVAPETPISEIDMVTMDEKKFLLTEKELKTDIFKDFTGIHQCIEQMVVSQPDKVAVTFKDTQITYRELDTKAHALAERILQKTGGSNDIIGLCVERSLEMIIGLLAILKAGCAYLPIDPKYPYQRIEYMLKDAHIQVLITQKELSPLFKNSDANRFFIDEISTRKDLPRVEMPTPKKDDLAYIIYTSGSTGQPKGVPITHSKILNSTAGRLGFYPKNPRAFLLLSSISFDSSKAGIFWTLCTGGNLIVAEDRIEQDMVEIGNTIQRNRITHMLLLPTLYQLILKHTDTSKLKSLTTIMVAGEACSVSLADTHFSTLPHTKLYNEYGPTETTVWCIAHEVDKSDQLSNVPIGRPVANAQIYLLDVAMNLAPLGAIGEIYIGGAGLSSGYLNRPELTASAYIDNPFSNDSGNKLYKTGDLARYNSNGDIEFLGRSDQQVKIRGYRVELEEIETAIRKLADVAQITVLAENNGKATKHIAAYLTADRPVAIAELKRSLKNSIPNYMVPSSIMQVDKIPVLPNGKIDKSALQKLKRVAESAESIEIQIPSNELESKLHAIWQEVLKLDQIGVHDNFFELGGDSILSIQFIAKARKAGISLTPNQIFDNQTIASLSQYVASKEKQTEEWDYLVALRKQGSEKPLFCIHAGGGHVFFYNILTKYIGAHRPIYALQASGVYADMEMHHSIEAMAKDYLRAIRSVQPKGPYNIMVYCFSVAVGHEMLIQLKEAGETANLIVMDTMTDLWKLDTNSRLKMRIKSFAKRILSNPIQTINGMVSVRILRMRLKLRRMTSKGDDRALAQLNANLEHICSFYAWRPHQEKVTLLLTEKPDESINKEIIGSWKKVALGGVEIVPVKGNHITLFAEPEVAIVAKKIDENCY